MISTKGIEEKGNKTPGVTYIQMFWARLQESQCGLKFMFYLFIYYYLFNKFHSFNFPMSKGFCMREPLWRKIKARFNTFKHTVTKIVCTQTEN